MKINVEQPISNAELRMKNLYLDWLLGFRCWMLKVHAFYSSAGGSRTGRTKVNVLPRLTMDSTAIPASIFLASS